MADKVALSLLIGGGVSASLIDSTTKAEKALSGLTKSVRQLKDADKKATALANLESSLDETRQKLKASSAETTRLAKALRTVENPSKGLQQAFERSSRESEKLKNSFRGQVESIGKLRRELEAAKVDTGNLSREQQRLTKELDRARTAQDNLVRAQGARVDNRQRINSLYAQGAEAAGLAYTLRRALAPAVEFESAMADVAKVVNFQSTEALKTFGDVLKGLSRQIPLTAVELAQIAAAGGRLGLTAEQLPDFVQVVARMSTAFDLLPSEAGDAIAKLSNIFDIPIKDIERLGDAINQLANNTAAREADIVNVLTRIGGTSRQFGLLSKESAALADAFLALGRPPQVAATAINALLNRLQAGEAQGQKFQDALASLGLTSTGLAQQIKAGPQQALLGFLDTLKKLDNQSRAVVLTNLFGQEYSDDISILVGGLDEYRKALGLVSRETDYAGGVQQEFGKRMETTGAQLQLLLNALNEVGNNFGAAFLPAVKGAAAGLQVIAVAVAQVERDFPGLIGVIGAAAAGFIALRIGVIAVRLALALLKQPVLVVAEAMAVVGTQGGVMAAAMGAVAGPAATATKAMKGFGVALRGVASVLALGGGLPAALVALGVALYAVRDAQQQAAAAQESLRQNTEAYRADLRGTMAVYATYADMHIKSAEQLAALGDDELKQYQNRLDEVEQYWRARSLLEQDYTGEVDIQTRERWRLALEGLRNLRGVLDSRGLAYEQQAKRVAEAKQVETEAIRSAFTEQRKIYDEELRKLDTIRKAREAFAKSVADLTRAPEAPGRSLIKDTVLEPLRDLQTGKAAAAAGDFQTAEASAKRVVQQLQALREAGKISQGYLNSLAQQAGDLGNQAYDGMQKAQEAKVEGIKRKLIELKSDAEFLQKLTIGFDDAAALSSMDELRKALQAKVAENPIVVPVTAGTSVPTLNDLPKRARGGKLYGPGTPTSDDILLWGSRDEWMIRAAAARYYGDDFMNAVNEMRLPKFATGGRIGAVPSFSLPPLQTLPSMPSAAPAGQPINLHFPDGQSFPLQGAPDVAQEITRYFRALMVKKGRR